MKRFFLFALILGAFVLASCSSTNYKTGTKGYSRSNASDFTLPFENEGNLLLKRNFNSKELLASTAFFLDGEYLGTLGLGKYWQGNITAGEHQIAAVRVTKGSSVNQLSSYSGDLVSKVKVTVSDDKMTILWVKLDGLGITLQEMPF